MEMLPHAPPWSIIDAMTRRVVLVALAALIVGACSDPESSVAPATTVVPSPTPQLVVGGDRPVTVHLPVSYDESRPAPLLILLHGYTGDGPGVVDFFRLAAAADEHGFVYAAPDGTRDGEGNRFWNATDACCNFEGREVDDSAYLAGVIAEIQSHLAIDPRRIAVAGHSNGGFMSHRMACDHADLVAAILSLSGATFADPADCTPSEPVSVVQAHGTADDVIRFEGGAIQQPYPGARASAESWARHDGCEATSSQLETRIDVDATLTDDGDPAEATVDEWSGCDAGAAVQLWTIPDAGHLPELTPAFADALLRFLEDHPKQEAPR
jgi:polyhydroxybutyrate depolymerase